VVKLQNFCTVYDFETLLSTYKTTWRQKATEKKTTHTVKFTTKIRKKLGRVRFYSGSRKAMIIGGKEEIEIQD